MKTHIQLSSQTISDQHTSHHERRSNKRICLICLIYVILICAIIQIHTITISNNNHNNTLSNINNNYIQLIPNVKSRLFTFEDNEQSQSKQLGLIKMTKFKNNQEIQKYIASMQKWDSKQPQHYGGNYKPTKTANIGYRFHSNPNSSMYQQVQYYFYNQIYDLDNNTYELPMCIIAAGKNLIKDDKYKAFFKSIHYQNYSNYQLIVVYDNSNDFSSYYIEEYIKTTLPRLKGRTKIISNYESVGALANKDNIIRKYCSQKQNSIIVDMDADDSLIGRQVFNILNSVYRNSSIWFVYSNHVVFEQENGYPQSGYSDKLRKYILLEGRYRMTEFYWVTGHVKTYRYSLYKKIPQSYFYQNPETQNYYLWASDRFIMYAMTELSVKGHYKHIPQCLYFYNRNPPRSDCTMAPIILDEYKARALTPFVGLSQLDEQVRLVQGYVMAEQIQAGLAQKKYIYEQCKKQKQMKQKLKTM